MRLQNKRIFLVEDNIGNQMITRTLLESHGAVMGVHRSGKDVIPHLRNFLPVDLIILDLMLREGVTGYDVFTSIRDRRDFDGVPIIAMSVMDRSDAVPLARRRGFAGYISKPINFQVFPQQIASIIDGQAIW
ncbi:MAG: response regulator [Chloroflexota bacterium]